MQTKKNNQQHIIVRARCTGQFMVYLATRTFQSIQNYLYKLSGKRPLPWRAMLVMLHGVTGGPATSRGLEI